MQSSKDKILDLQSIITKMPLQVCCTTVLPEFSVRWKEVSKAVRNARMPMTPASVARVLCRHAMRTLPEDEVDEILGRLRLKLILTQPRTWHVIHLLEPTAEEPFAVMMRTLPHRILQALKNGKNKNARPEVQSVMMDDLLFISVQLVWESKESSILYIATPPGQPIALVTSLSGAVLKGVVQGLGFKKYENADLHGKDIPSLLRISDPAWNANAEYLSEIPDYNPMPVLLKDGIDYTNKNYDESYIDKVLGPNPPLLTELNIKTSRMFFDRSRLNKPLSLTVTLKTDNVANTLRNWVLKGALSPTSDLFQIFHKIKSNRIVFDKDSD